jgi:hypothetical protein
MASQNPERVVLIVQGTEQPAQVIFKPHIVKVDPASSIEVFLLGCLRDKCPARDAAASIHDALVYASPSGGKFNAADLNWIQVQLDNDISDVLECGKHVAILFPKPAGVDSGSTARTPNAFDLLRTASQRVSAPGLPPQVESPTNNKQKLHNAVLELLAERSCLFKGESIESTGRAFVTTLTNLLWYIDAAHDRINTEVGRACATLEGLAGSGVSTARSRGRSQQGIPKVFSRFQGFDDWQRKQKARPNVRKARFTELEEDMYRFIPTGDSWGSGHEQWADFKAKLADLADVLHSYRMYLRSLDASCRAEAREFHPLTPSGDSWHVPDNRGVSNQKSCCCACLPPAASGPFHPP